MVGKCNWLDSKLTLLTFMFAAGFAVTAMLIIILGTVLMKQLFAILLIVCFGLIGVWNYVARNYAPIMKAHVTLEQYQNYKVLQTSCL